MRDWRTSAELVSTTMPLPTLVEQAGTSERAPFTFTTQTKHDANGSSCASSQSVGMVWMPCWRATWRIVWLPSAMIRLPSISSFTSAI